MNTQGGESSKMAWNADYLSFVSPQSISPVFNYLVQGTKSEATKFQAVFQIRDLEKICVREHDSFMEMLSPKTGGLYIWSRRPP